MSNLLEKLQKAGSIKIASTLDESPFFNEKELVTTDIPALNIALSGKLDGGLGPGLLVIAGMSKSFKSMLSLYMIKSYLNQYKDAICLFYDSEFGTNLDYFNSLSINTSKILHIPIEHIEQLKFDIVKRLEQIQKEDKVIIFLDSLGNLASKKEVDDAIDEKSVSDMTRAKAIRSLFRIISPHLAFKDIPMIAVNHVYDQIGPIYPQKVMGGGTSIMYSANTVWFMGKVQDKDGTELTGYNFYITIEKSRFVREKSKIDLMVSFDEGINKWSGLLSLALESGHVIKPSIGWYQKIGEEKKYRESDTENEIFWNSILIDNNFGEFIKTKFRFAENDLLGV